MFFEKIKAKKELVKRGFLFILVLTLAGISVYGAHKLSKGKKREASTKNGRRNNRRQPGGRPTRDQTRRSISDPATCDNLHSLFVSNLNEYFEYIRDDADSVRLSYQQAKDACTGLPNAEYYTKTLSELAKDKYDEALNIFFESSDLHTCGNRCRGVT